MDKDEFGRITPENTALVVIDIQEKFRPHIHEVETMIENAAKLVRGCGILGVPIVVTEQNPAGLGPTVPDIKEHISNIEPLEKTAFSIFDDKVIASAIKELGRPNLLLCGVEAHVCLIQSAMQGLALGYNIHWISDAISSRSKTNIKAATKRMIQCGAFSSSVEMALFQMLGSSGHPNFREISKLVK